MSTSSLPSNQLVEPVVAPINLARAIGEDPEPLRALLPVGYAAGVEAYRSAVASMTAYDLSAHYTTGLAWFHEGFVPALKARLSALTGGVWSLDEHVAIAAGNDVDLMALLVDTVTARGRVATYPGDWHGFRVGAAHADRVVADRLGRADLACLCVPSGRNGHLTDEMMAYLDGADAALLNLNLFPTMPADERRAVAEALLPVLPRAVLSISFSRGFGLTASQLGVALVPADHPLRKDHTERWAWLTRFYNAVAARAFLALDPEALQRSDAARRQFVESWLAERDLPSIVGGSYYVRSFRLSGKAPDALKPLVRDNVVRLCFKPPVY